MAVNSRGREDYSEGGGPVVKVTEGVSLAPAGLVSTGTGCQVERLLSFSGMTGSNETGFCR